MVWINILGKIHVRPYWNVGPLILRNHEFKCSVTRHTNISWDAQQRTDTISIPNLCYQILCNLGNSTLVILSIIHVRLETCRWDLRTSPTISMAFLNLTVQLQSYGQRWNTGAPYTIRSAWMDPSSQTYLLMTNLLIRADSSPSPVLNPNFTFSLSLYLYYSFTISPFFLSFSFLSFSLFL